MVYNSKQYGFSIASQTIHTWIMDHISLAILYAIGIWFTKDANGKEQRLRTSPIWTETANLRIVMRKPQIAISLYRAIVCYGFTALWFFMISIAYNNTIPKLQTPYLVANLLLSEIFLENSRDGTMRCPDAWLMDDVSVLYKQ